MKITKIEGVGEVISLKLAREGIRTTEGLLKAAASRPGRRSLAKETGIPEKMILNWVNKADLMRVRGIGEEYSDLLEAAGVDTVRELAVRRADNLHKAIVRVNAEKKLVRRPPSQSEVAGWVEKATQLAPVVTH